MICDRGRPNAGNSREARKMLLSKRAFAQHLHERLQRALFRVEKCSRTHSSFSVLKVSINYGRKCANRLCPRLHLPPEPGPAARCARQSQLCFHLRGKGQWEVRRRRAPRMDTMSAGVTSRRYAGGVALGSDACCRIWCASWGSENKAILAHPPPA